MAGAVGTVIALVLTATLGEALPAIVAGGVGEGAGVLVWTGSANRLVDES